jgi:SAM-dependent methyltransferase
LPLAAHSLDSVAMLGGIHHVNDRAALFAEIFRVLKPGGRFIFREPVSDFILWRAIRAVIYRLSPVLDHETERPLLHVETVPVLDRAGFRTLEWKTYGFLGFCLLMNSDVLVFNRLFRFIPGIRAITRGAAALDDMVTRLPGLRRSGLIVVGVAEKPAVARTKPRAMCGSGATRTTPRPRRPSTISIPMSPRSTVRLRSRAARTN